MKKLTIQTLDYNGFEIRVIPNCRFGIPYFISADICKATGINNGRVSVICSAREFLTKSDFVHGAPVSQQGRSFAVINAADAQLLFEDQSKNRPEVVQFALWLAGHATPVALLHGADESAEPAGPMDPMDELYARLDDKLASLETKAQDLKDQLAAVNVRIHRIKNLIAEEKADV